MSIEFEIVDDSFRDSLPGSGKYSRNVNPLVEALVEGKTVFISVEDGDKINGLYDTARRRGFSFRARKVNKDGTVGHLGWFEKKEEPDATSAA